MKSLVVYDKKGSTSTKGDQKSSRWKEERGKGQPTDAKRADIVIIMYFTCFGF